ncbi:MAG: DNA polymerase III subunit alpha [Bacteroidia bacterium]
MTSNCAAVYLIFDTETTGLPRRHEAPASDTDNWPRMVQLAWQLHDGQGQLLEVYNMLVRPDGFTIPYNAEQVHRISTQKALDEGMPLDFVLERFSSALEQCQYIAGHNLLFDVRVVEAECIRRGTPCSLSSKSLLDTKEWSTQFCALPGGKGGRYKWPSLTELHKKLFGTGFEEAHDASFDVEATARCFLELIRLGVIPAAEAGLHSEAYHAFIEAHPVPVEAVGLHTPVYQPDSHTKIDAHSGSVPSANEQDSERFRLIPEPNESEDHLARGDQTELPFVHLHCHSQYSLLPGTSTVEDLARFAAEQGAPAIALTDHGNMYGAFAFSEACRKVGIKAILGLEAYLCRNHRDHKTRDHGYHQVLLARNEEGYRNLIRLSSAAFVDGFYYVPRIDKELLLKHKTGLIALSGGTTGEIAATLLNVGEQQAEDSFQWWQEHFGDDFYVSLQRHGLPEEEYVEPFLLKWAAKYGVRVLATNNTYYNRREDADTHDTLWCINEKELKQTPVGRGRGFRPGFSSDTYYLRSNDEMRSVFRDRIENCSETFALAERCESYTLKRDVLLPRFELPDGFADQDDYLRHLTYEGALKLYPEISAELKERIDFELDIIRKTGYPGYFLIVQDFTARAREMGVRVGPGRGSAAGSVVAYCTGITQVDPLAYDLLFERFLNPDRVSLPDIDIDFDDRGRSRVMQYVVDKYGPQQVAQIITYGTMAAKSAIRDASRVLELPLADADRLAKSFPDELSRHDAFKKAPLETLIFKPDLLKKHRGDFPSDRWAMAETLQEAARGDNLTARVLHQAARLEGSVRSTGTHACGVIISPEPLADLVPVKSTEDSGIRLVIQFDNDVAESAGLLKMDFLGLSTLTILNDALDIIKERHGKRIEIEKIPLDDSETYELFQRGDTVGIFQYESVGMQRYLRELKPDRFDDLIAMNALFRPGPLQYIPNYIKRKHGQEAITYDLPGMETYLESTYGITVYQEQVMLLSQQLAGFTKGQADELRKAMGKKIREKLDKLKPMFLEGCAERSHPTEKANKIWADWEKFAEYAFNKSHSTCYALIGYQTAWLKTHYPAEYMAAVLSNNLNDISKVAFFMEECRRMGLEVLGPDVEESSYRFTVNAAGQIRFGLGGVKNVGEAAVDALVAERRRNGRFTSLFDLCKRMDGRAVNRKFLESLALAGAFDRFPGVNGNRRLFFEDDQLVDGLLERALKFGQKFQQSQSQMQGSLFGDDVMNDIQEPPMGSVSPWAVLEQLQREKEVVGIFLTAHPLDAYSLELSHFCNVTLKALEEQPERELSFAMLVTEVQYVNDSRNQSDSIAFTGEDYQSVRKFRIRGEQALKYKHMIQTGQSLLCRGRFEAFEGRDGGKVSFFRFHSIELLSDARGKRFRELMLNLEASQVTDELTEGLYTLLNAHPGPVALRVRLSEPGEHIQVELSARHGGIEPGNVLLDGLKDLGINYELR